MHIIERAYQLAAAGKSLGELKAVLKQEGFGMAEVGAHLDGRTFRAKLRQLASANQAPDPSVPSREAGEKSI
jgi:hypothetical protein